MSAATLIVPAFWMVGADVLYAERLSADSNWNVPAAWFVIAPLAVAASPRVASMATVPELFQARSRIAAVGVVLADAAVVDDDGAHCSR